MTFSQGVLGLGVGVWGFRDETKMRMKGMVRILQYIPSTGLCYAYYSTYLALGCATTILSLELSAAYPLPVISAVCGANFINKCSL